MLGYWNIGVLEYWKIGILEDRHNGIFGYWIIGVEYVVVVVVGIAPLSRSHSHQDLTAIKISQLLKSPNYQNIPTNKNATKMQWSPNNKQLLLWPLPYIFNMALEFKAFKKQWLWKKNLPK